MIVAYLLVESNKIEGVKEEATVIKELALQA